MAKIYSKNKIKKSIKNDFSIAIKFTKKGAKTIKVKINDPIINWVTNEKAKSLGEEIGEVSKEKLTFNHLQEQTIKESSFYLTFFSYLYKFIIGLFAGVCSIIPGLSGATIFSATGTWDMVNDSISSMTKIFSNRKAFFESSMFLIPMVIGMGIGYLSFAFFYGFLVSNLVTDVIPSTEIALYIFFALVTLFAVISVWSKNSIKVTKRRFSFFTIFFMLILSLGFISLFTPAGTNWYEDISYWVEWIVAFFLGIIMFSTMIIPGVSGSLMLLVLGMYDWCITQVTSFNFSFIGFFLIGGVLGIILTSKLLEKVTKAHPETSFYSVMGTMSSSFVVVLMTAPWFLIGSITSAYTIPIAIIVALLFIMSIKNISRR